MTRTNALVLFERGSALLAATLAATLLIALTVRLEQNLWPDDRLETFESQYAALWSGDDPMFVLATPVTAAVAGAIRQHGLPIR